MTISLRCNFLLGNNRWMALSKTNVWVGVWVRETNIMVFHYNSELPFTLSLRDFSFIADQQAGQSKSHAFEQYILKVPYYTHFSSHFLASCSNQCFAGTFTCLEGDKNKLLWASLTTWNKHQSGCVVTNQGKLSVSPLWHHKRLCTPTGVWAHTFWKMEQVKDGLPSFLRSSLAI